MIEVHSSIGTGRLFACMCMLGAWLPLALPASVQAADPADYGAVRPISAYGGSGTGLVAVGAQPLDGPGVQVDEQTSSGDELPNDVEPAGTRAGAADDLSGESASAQIASDITPATPSEGGAVAGAPREPRDPASYYDLWVLLPAVVAILLAIFARQVVPALVVGVFVGAYMLVPCLSPGDEYAQHTSVVAGFRLAAERFVLGAITDPKDGYGHIKIIVFTLVIGFTIGIIGRNGGTRGMVKLIAGDTVSRRRGALTTWLAGLVVFFDDYANTMIIGPTMRSVFDRLKMSRAKLAYIIDSTAAPVASIALIGTWVGLEIGYIQDGLNTVAESGAPLLDDEGNVISGMHAFLYSIPYRFYPILALLLVFLVALTGRDFGPMKRSERKILSKIEPDRTTAESEEAALAEAPATWWLGLIPIAVLVGVTAALLVVTGRHAEQTIQAIGAVSPDGAAHWTQKVWKASDIVSNADPYLSMFYGALFSAIIAVVLTLVARACSIRETFDAGVEGMSRMFSAMIILVLAWALSGVLQDLKLGDVVVAHLKAQEFPAQWLPLAVFLSSAVVSFATGTSWGTMAILCPLTVVISADLVVGLDSAEALKIFYAAVGSVLAGAVFGDHCSPISDTTVLSSIASGCRHEEHVWTQIPYALVAAIAAMGLGDVLCSVYKQPWYLGMGAGTVFLILVVLIVGRRASPSFELADA